mmetsp:Transcript_315/g.577  ORF Transcript_315/g.577 Transcript_315/m.577 type:complete len:309 (-) Transcript_315:39-965(-)
MSQNQRNSSQFPSNLLTHPASSTCDNIDETLRHRAQSFSVQHPSLSHHSFPMIPPSGSRYPPPEANTASSAEHSQVQQSQSAPASATFADAVQTNDQAAIPFHRHNSFLGTDNPRVRAATGPEAFRGLSHAELLSVLTRDHNGASEGTGNISLLESVSFINMYLELMDLYDARCVELMQQCRDECSAISTSVQSLSFGGGDHGMDIDVAGTEAFEEMDESALQSELRRRYQLAAERLQESDQAPSKWRGNLPKDAVAILRQWVAENSDPYGPYPDDNDKRELAARTGLPQRQISNWFINYRKRHLNNN